MSLHPSMLDALVKDRQARLLGEAELGSLRRRAGRRHRPRQLLAWGTTVLAAGLGRIAALGGRKAHAGPVDDATVVTPPTAIADAAPASITYDVAQHPSRLQARAEGGGAPTRSNGGRKAHLRLVDEGERVPVTASASPRSSTP